MDNNIIFPKELAQKIPIEFAPILITGYDVPIRDVVPEEKIDEFLEKNPHLIDKKNSIAEQR